MKMKSDEILEFENENTTLKTEIKEMWIEKELDKQHLANIMEEFAEQIKNRGINIKEEISVPLKPIKKTWGQKTKEWFKNLKKKFDRIFIYNYTEDEIDFFKNEKNYY